MDVVFFASSDEFRKWLTDNHDRTAELQVGYYKKASGKPSITYPESVDQALCFGWIDGIRKSIDDERYTIRFTPRKAHSIWSAVNIRRANELEALGLMQPSGLKAFHERDQEKTQRYSYEQRPEKLDEADERRFKENPQAWAFFQAQAPSYQRAAIWWVISAKKEETQKNHLTTLIETSEKGERIPQFVSPNRRKK
jgi:uncharacterized protein YdeI (YjbR/CyaY-like superfamily)